MSSQGVTRSLTRFSKNGLRVSSRVLHLVSRHVTRGCHPHAGGGGGREGGGREEGF